MRLQGRFLIFKLLLFLLANVKSEYACPVRIISNNAHSSSSMEDDDPANLLANDHDYDGLPEGGENLRPFSNNSGFISSDRSIRKNYKW
jgi:hypothetical protein